LRRKIHKFSGKGHSPSTDPTPSPPTAPIFSRLWHSTCDPPMFQWCWRPWLRWASSLCSQRDAACICWWAPVSCCLEYGAWTYRLISPATQRSASNPPSTVATADRTDGRTPDRYIDSAPHTTQATSKRCTKKMHGLSRTEIYAYKFSIFVTQWHETAIKRLTIMTIIFNSRHSHYFTKSF